VAARAGADDAAVVHDHDQAIERGLYRTERFDEFAHVTSDLFSSPPPIARLRVSITMTAGAALPSSARMAAISI
jgi:hypothetical protein